MSRFIDSLNFSNENPSGVGAVLQIKKGSGVNFYETLCKYCANNSVDLKEVTVDLFDVAVDMMIAYGQDDKNTDRYYFWIDTNKTEVAGSDLNKTLVSLEIGKLTKQVNEFRELLGISEENNQQLIQQADDFRTEIKELESNLCKTVITYRGTDLTRTTDGSLFFVCPKKGTHTTFRKINLAKGYIDSVLDE